MSHGTRCPLRKSQSTENRDWSRYVPFRGPFPTCLLLATLLCGIAGCQFVRPHSDAQAAGNSESGDDSNRAFMELWEVYTHCQTNEDPKELLMDAMRLNQAAETPPKVPTLLDPMEQIMEPLPVRLPVDPKAMAAACSLHAAHAAMDIGWNDTAINLYRSIIPTPPDAQSNYYIERAQEGLAEAVNRKARHPRNQVPLSSATSRTSSSP